MRSVGARNDPPATLALDRGGSARRAEPKGRVDDLEVVEPQKAEQSTDHTGQLTNAPPQRATSDLHGGCFVILSLSLRCWSFPFPIPGVLQSFEQEYTAIDLMSRSGSVSVGALMCVRLNSPGAFQYATDRLPV